MKRTKPAKGKTVMVNYYDGNKAQRWGKLTQEGREILSVVNAHGEKEKVPRRKVIEIRETTLTQID